MKINRWMRILVITMVILIGLGSVDLSYGTNMTSNPQINSRGLVFNTGKSSDQIRLLKDFFRARGEKNVPWGYNYDSRTKELVRNYQRQHGLGSDGIAGKTTIDRINREIRDRGFKIGLRVPYTDVKGDMIIINKSSNTLYFLTNGLVKESYPVATGKTSDLTPDGRHRVVVKSKNPGWGGAGRSEPIPGGAANNPLGKRWIGISYGGGGKYGMHGNSNSNSIGTYASLGCVRMFNSDVEKFYEGVKINTPTWIGDEGTLMKYGVSFKSNYQEKKPVKEAKKEETEYSKAVIRLNGDLLDLKDPVINRKGMTYYPFREILQEINARITWDEKSKRATANLAGNDIEFEVGSNKYKTNGAYKYLPKGQKVFIDRGKTYVPVRDLMESLGYKVDWEQSTRTIIIDNRL